MIETQVELSLDAMNLAHAIGLREDGLRTKGYTAERIASLRGREFGSKIAKLAIHDPTAQLIYSPREMELSDHIPMAPKEVPGETLTPLAKWAQETYAKNMGDAGIGGVRDRAFRD